jgi:hypothetical protein
MPMRFIIMHKTNAHWESGAKPSADLIARVRTLLGELAKKQMLIAGEGLGPSADGVRVKVARGRRTVIKGPLAGENELPSGFHILRVRSEDEAVESATRQADVLGDAEFDIRPVSEPWDIGLSPRPPEVTTRRYMILRKATASDEAGATPTMAQRAQLSRLIDEAIRARVHVAAETMRPSARGRRYKNSVDGISVFDGPFVESKELLGGYVIVSAASIDAAGQIAHRYIDTVGAAEVDLRELE